MEQRLRTLGVLHMIYGGMVLVYQLGSLAIVGQLGGAFGRVGIFDNLGCPQVYDLFGFIGPLMGYIAFMIIIFSGALILGGWGLYNRTNWGRITALVMGVLCLFRIPFGTALGIYTLYVLTKPEAAQLTKT